jgi:hypothetical protein
MNSQPAQQRSSVSGNLTLIRFSKRDGFTSWVHLSRSSGRWFTLSVTKRKGAERPDWSGLDIVDFGHSTCSAAGVIGSRGAAWLACQDEPPV